MLSRLLQRADSVLLERVLQSVLTGLLYVIVYVFLVPLSFYYLLSVYSTPVSYHSIGGGLVLLLSLLVFALGFLERFTSGVLSVVFRFLSKLYGVYLLYILMYRGVFTVIVSSYVITLNISPLIILILLISVIYALVDSVEYLSDIEE